MGSLFQDAEARGSYHHSCIKLYSILHHQLWCTVAEVNVLRHQTVDIGNMMKDITLQMHPVYSKPSTAKYCSQV